MTDYCSMCGDQTVGLQQCGRCLKLVCPDCDEPHADCHDRDDKGLDE